MVSSEWGASTIVGGGTAGGGGKEKGLWLAICGGGDRSH